MAITILQSEFVTQLILPFLLIFTIIFAILDRTKILGEGKKQINAIISFVIALIFVSFSYAVGIIVNLMPVLAVVVVVILIFMILYGFAAGGKEFSMPKGLKITFGILIGLVLIIALLYFTGYWDNVTDYWDEFVSGGNNVLTNIIFIAIIIGAIAVVLSTGKKEGSSS